MRARSRVADDDARNMAEGAQCTATTRPSVARKLLIRLDAVAADEVRPAVALLLEAGGELLGRVEDRHEYLRLELLRHRPGAHRAADLGGEALHDRRRRAGGRHDAGRSYHLQRQT